MNLVAKIRREGVSGLARSAYERARDALTDHPVHKALAELADQPAVSIVQVGAYIGPSSNDPLAAFLRTRSQRPGLTAILVEPVRRHYDKLRANYAGLPGVRCVNAAVAATAGELPFHCLSVDPADYGKPEWYAQLGSLKADRMGDLWARQSQDRDAAEFWSQHGRTEWVRGVTLTGLLAEHQLAHLEFLQIDAEGSDGDILRSIDFATCRPRAINYERVLLGDQGPAIRTMLRRAGYSLRDHGQDTFARLTSH